MAMSRLTTDLRGALDPAYLMQRAGMTPDPWQVEALRSRAQQLLLLCSRQSGKSTVAAVLAMHTALYAPGSLTLLLSPTLRQSQELFKIVTKLYTRLDAPIAITRASALQVEYVNGGRIVSLPGEEQNIRGYSDVTLLVCDEAARIEDELYFSVRPMLAVSGGRLLLLSTPHGRQGAFFQTWDSGEDWHRVRVTAAQCPRISKAFLDQERAAMGEWWFEQEFFCEFKESMDQVFSHDRVMRALSEDAAVLWETDPLGPSA
jgi:hypothetical protein